MLFKAMGYGLEWDLKINKAGINKLRGRETIFQVVGEIS